MSSWWSLASWATPNVHLEVQTLVGECCTYLYISGQIIMTYSRRLGFPKWWVCEGILPTKCPKHSGLFTVVHETLKSWLVMSHPRLYTTPIVFSRPTTDTPRDTPRMQTLCKPKGLSRWWFLLEVSLGSVEESWFNNFYTEILLIQKARWWFQIFFYFHPYLGKIPILTNIFQTGGSTTN